VGDAQRRRRWERNGSGNGTGGGGEDQGVIARCEETRQRSPTRLLTLHHCNRGWVRRNPGDCQSFSPTTHLIAASSTLPSPRRHQPQLKSHLYCLYCRRHDRHREDKRGRWPGRRRAAKSVCTLYVQITSGTDNKQTEATREEMSAARLPLAYRDSCAHLLIPLNRCRHDEMYLPWKCEVRMPSHNRVVRQLTAPGRAPFIREVPVRGIQAARSEDGGAEGSQGRSEEQLNKSHLHAKGGQDVACTYPQQNVSPYRPMGILSQPAGTGNKKYIAIHVIDVCRQLLLYRSYGFLTVLKCS
jgi:hypothetical protein